VSCLHWSGDAPRRTVDPLALLVAARREAELRVLERHLVADVNAGELPPAVLAGFDQWKAAGAPGWRGWPGLHEG